MVNDTMSENVFVVPVYGMSEQERNQLFDNVYKQIEMLFGQTNNYPQIHFETMRKNGAATSIVITGIDLKNDAHADFLSDYLSTRLQHHAWTRDENIEALMYMESPSVKWDGQNVYCPAVYVRQPYAEFLSATFAPEVTMASAIRTCYSKADPKSMFDKFLAEMNASPQQTLDRITELYTGCMESGHHSVFEHFNVTFAVGGSRACYSWDTEVYTKRGWCLFSLLLPEDEFLTRRKDGTVYFQKPNSIIRYPYFGKMHWYKGSGNIDLMVTPDHRVLAKKYDVSTESDFSLLPSEELKTVKRWYMTKKMKVEHTLSEIFNIPSMPYRVGGGMDTTIKMTEEIQISRFVFYKFLAWYLGEGSCRYSWRDNSYLITISQQDLPKNTYNREEISECVRALGFTPHATKTGIHFKSLEMGLYLTKLGVSYEKYIPLDLFAEFNAEYATLFLDTCARRDGNIDSTGHRKLYTTSWKLADQLQMLAFISGISANIREDNRVGKFHRGPRGTQIRHNHICYVVSLSEGINNVEPVIEMDTHMCEIDYSHMVYCAELSEDHVMFVRRNGVPIWSGNCSHQLVRHRIASFSQQSQRYIEADAFPVVIPPTLRTSERVVRYLMYMESQIREYKDMLTDQVEKEDARFVFGNGAFTQLTVTMNVRSLMNFFAHRCCHCAQWEIRQIAIALLKALKKEFPVIFNHPYMGAKCHRLGYCEEKPERSCGMYPLRAKVLSAYDELQELRKKYDQLPKV